MYVGLPNYPYLSRSFHICLNHLNPATDDLPKNLRTDDLPQRFSKTFQRAKSKLRWRSVQGIPSLCESVYLKYIIVYGSETEHGV